MAIADVSEKTLTVCINNTPGIVKWCPQCDGYYFAPEANHICPLCESSFVSNCPELSRSDFGKEESIADELLAAFLCTDALLRSC